MPLNFFVYSNDKAPPAYFAQYSPRAKSTRSITGRNLYSSFENDGQTRGD
jgi:hypothetical protein